MYDQITQRLKLQFIKEASIGVGGNYNSNPVFAEYGILPESTGFDAFYSNGSKRSHFAAILLDVLTQNEVAILNTVD